MKVHQTHEGGLDRTVSSSRAVVALGYTSMAPWWWWNARPLLRLHGATTMLVIGLILNVFGIGLFCWLIFTLTVYALPFFAGLWA